MKQDDDRIKIPCIIPTIVSDYVRMEPDFDNFFNCLPISELIFIGPSELDIFVQRDVVKYPHHKISYLNESSLVSYERIKDIIDERMKSEGYSEWNIRYGWYLQQFLKMAYYEICESEYYMSWDMDTIPLREIEMFSADNIPYFDLKKEHNPAYFDTINNLFGFGKIIERSFVSEHMVFRKELLRKMIDEIMELSVKGDTVFEKILYSIKPDNLPLGFSEFETYGSWVAMRYPQAYKLREWSSWRRGSWFLNRKDLTDDDMLWLSKDYEAVTFEDRGPYPEMNELFRSKHYREKLSAKQFYHTVLESGYFGEYEDGKISKGDWSVPV